MAHIEDEITIKAKLKQNNNIKCNLQKNSSINANIQNGANIQSNVVARGLQGIPGEAATITIGTVTTGEPGTDASVVNSGTENAAIFNFTIPRGETGAPGTDGTSADITGVTASITNTVGVPAVTVTMGGTEFARTFDFAFSNLKGNKGDKGSNGNSIMSITKTATSGLVDTYTIQYSLFDDSYFCVTNGKDGTDGINGTDGTDGFSPLASVTQSGDVTTISITDENGTTTESIDLSAYAKTSALAGYVPTSRKINTYPLSADITLSYSDVGALASTTTINDLTTTAQQNALNSGATTTNIGQIATNTSDISTINGLIPSQATTSNQLADKAFVNSSVQTATANFRGNWTDWSDVPSVATDYPVDYAGNKTPTVNDYLVVQDVSDYTLDTLEGTWRFKYSGSWADDGKSGWLPEYQVNETPLTQAQLDALDSGITAADVTLIGTAVQPSDLAAVATSGDYSDLLNTPSIPTKLSDITVNAGSNITINGDTISATDTTYSAFTGADSITAGSSGLVPAPSAGDEGKFLKGDGSWDTIPAGISYTFSTGLTETSGTVVVTDYNKLVKNDATGTGTIAISNNTGSSYNYDTALGASSRTGGNSVAIGYDAHADETYSIAIGSEASIISPALTSAIQIGYGSNDTDNSLNIGFYNNSNTHYNWLLLDGTTGLIPDARISSNIQRTNTAVTHTASTAVGDSDTPVYIASDGTATSTGKSIASTRFDGQVVEKNLSLDTSSSVHASSFNLGTNGYLPNDYNDYVYLVFGQLQGSTSNSTVSYGTVGTAASPEDNDCIKARIEGNSNARRTDNYFILPVKNGNIYTQVKQQAWSTFSCTLYGYRRLGTNT